MSLLLHILFGLKRYSSTQRYLYGHDVTDVSTAVNILLEKTKRFLSTCHTIILAPFEKSPYSYVIILLNDILSIFDNQVNTAINN